jgi:hypothetical protein
MRNWLVGSACVYFVPALVLSLVWPREAAAWGPDGHEIVAAIAEQHLTPEAREGLRRLLGSARIYDDAVANFADHVRPSRPETGPWHFVDIPVTAEKFEHHRDCGPEGCVIDKIEDFRQTLADDSGPREHRAEALKFVVHLLGDLHQPLHCADNHDRGGNEVKVKYPGQRRTANLHKTFDSLVLHDLMGEDQDPLDYATELDARISRQQIEKWTAPGSTLVDWANESHALAKQIYTELGTPAPGGQTINLPENYGAAHKDAVEEQLMKGGIRLASVLNDAFRHSSPGERRFRIRPGIRPPAPDDGIGAGAGVAVEAAAERPARGGPIVPDSAKMKLVARRGRE